jgi:hypothetical protein
MIQYNPQSFRGSSRSSAAADDAPKFANAGESTGCVYWMSDAYGSFFIYGMWRFRLGLN